MVQVAPLIDERVETDPLQSHVSEKLSTKASKALLGVNKQASNADLLQVSEQVILPRFNSKEMMTIAPRSTVVHEVKKSFSKCSSLDQSRNIQKAINELSKQSLERLPKQSYFKMKASHMSANKKKKFDHVRISKKSIPSVTNTNFDMERFMRTGINKVATYSTH